VSAAIDIETPHGVARAHLSLHTGAHAALVLGHGAGGGVDAPDLVAVSRAAVSVGLSVVRVEQPYRVAGRRASAPVGQLDTAWLAVLDRLRLDELAGLALVAGGRSSGARVACRTAAAAGAIAVLCLAFPLRPPRRPEATPAASRIEELDAVTVPTLVIQGERDPFGMPLAAAQRTVVPVAGDHGLKADLSAVAAAAEAWLASVIGPASGGGRSTG
jgi:predicted alpha/beta-hydrolase family hydrolase